MSKRKNRARKNKENYNAVYEKRIAKAEERARIAEEQDDIFALCANLLYLEYMEDTSIGTEKRGFKKWLTEEKKQEIIDMMTEFKEHNTQAEQWEKEWDQEWEDEWVEKMEDEEDILAYKEAKENPVVKMAARYDLSDENECKEFLELLFKIGIFEGCPRCGEKLIYPVKSRNAKITVCQKCWKDEEHKAQQHKADCLTDWQFIQHLQEDIARCA